MRQVSPGAILAAVAAALSLAALTAPGSASSSGPPPASVPAGFVGAAAPATPAPPRLGVSSAILVAPATGQRLAAVAADARRAIASTTKLMTALITLEHVRQLSTVFAQNDFVAAPVDSQIGLRPGERMSVHDLLLALVLPSADDAAEDLAYNIGRRSVARFVGMMNARARELGLGHTHYSTPSGLDTPGNYSSAADLVTLAGYVLHHQPFFARIVALPRAVLRTGDHVRSVVNRNTLLTRFPWINGVKTGHTSAAGYVLVGSAHRDGFTLLSAVLGTDSESARDANTLALFAYGFHDFRLAAPLVAGTVLARPTVRDRPGAHALLIAAAGLRRVIPRSSRLTLLVQAPRQIAGPLPRLHRQGTVVVLLDGRPVARIPLLLAHALPAVSPLTLAARFLTRGTTLFALVLLLGAALSLAAFRRLRDRGIPLKA